MSKTFVEDIAWVICTVLNLRSIDLNLLRRSKRRIEWRRVSHAALAFVDEHVVAFEEGGSTASATLRR